MTTIARIAIGLLLLTLIGADCDEHPNLDAGFELLDAVAPSFYHQVEETSRGAEAIRRYRVPRDEARPEMVDLPSGYERQEDFPGLGTFDDLRGVKTLAVWLGPSLSGDTTCALHFGVVPDGAGSQKDKLVELLAACAFAS